MDKAKITVRVAGRDYALSSAHDGAQVARMVALLNRRIDELGLLHTRVDRETLAVAAALSMADDLLRAEDDNTRLRRALATNHDTTTSQG